MSRNDAGAHVPDLTELLRLDGARAVVTGAARGIGRAVVVRLLQAGARVTAVDTAPRSIAFDMAGDSLAWHRADVRDSAVTAEIFASIPDVSILVNNAGAYPLREWTEVGPEEWANAIETNLSSVARYSRIAADRMISAGTRGVIVNISSVAGIRPVPMLVPYGTAKAGVRHLTRALAAEYGRYGIRVNTVTPGGIQTEGAAAAKAQSASMPGGPPQRQRPLGNIGAADDVACAVLYFVSAMSRYVTGAELVVDGGYLLT